MQSEEHDIFLRKLIQWLGLLRNMSCSSAFVDLGSKGRHKATTRNGVPRGKGACGGVSCKLALCLVCSETDSVCIVFV